MLFGKYLILKSKYFIYIYIYIDGGDKSVYGAFNELIFFFILFFFFFSSSNVVSILSVSKGQTLISRVLPYISDYQQNGLMTIIASHIADLPFRPSELEVNKVDLVDYKEKLELRLSFLMRHVSAFLVQSPLSYIIDALSYTANHSNFNCLIASMVNRSKDKKKKRIID